MNNEKELIKCTSQILTLAEEVYKELGSGFKEDTLQQALAISFRKAGIKYLRETHLEIFYKKESLGLFRLDFLIPAQKNKKWQLKTPIVIETKASSKLNNDAHLQLKNYLISLPKNSSEELKNITEGILLNWKNNLDPGATGKELKGTEIELWSYKSNRFKLLNTNSSEA
jgi:GxxExxY protein|tara:strand:- start:15 stop:524 length:510 start_codon:yes stop_codon:yes gene_type:complete